MPRLNRASARSKIYVQLINDGFTKKDAAIAAGYSPATAHNAARAIESQATVQRYTYRQHGAQSIARQIVMSLSEGIRATKVVKVKVLIVEKDTDNNFHILRKLNLFEEVPDHKIRYKILENWMNNPE
jgi:RNA-binding protein YhbY